MFYDASPLIRFLHELFTPLPVDEPVAYALVADTMTPVRIRLPVPKRRPRRRLTLPRVAVLGWALGFALAVIFSPVFQRPAGRAHLAKMPHGNNRSLFDSRIVSSPESISPPNFSAKPFRL